VYFLISSWWAAPNTASRPSRCLFFLYFFSVQMTDLIPHPLVVDGCFPSSFRVTCEGRLYGPSVSFSRRILFFPFFRLRVWDYVRTLNRPVLSPLSSFLIAFSLGTPRFFFFPVFPPLAGSDCPFLAAKAVLFDPFFPFPRFRRPLVWCRFVDGFSQIGLPPFTMPPRESYWQF